MVALINLITILLIIYDYNHKYNFITIQQTLLSLSRSSDSSYRIVHIVIRVLCDAVAMVDGVLTFRIFFDGVADDCR